ncbi:hypothetical protein Tco_0594219 [Tanacetum coccineum]
MKLISFLKEWNWCLENCNNDKNLSEIQLEHEKEDEFVNGGEGDCKKKCFETKRKDWDEKILNPFFLNGINMDEMTIGTRLEWRRRRSYHLTHEVFSYPDPLVSFARNEEQADAWLDHMRDMIKG